MERLKPHLVYLSRGYSFWVLHCRKEWLDSALHALFMPADTESKDLCETSGSYVDQHQGFALKDHFLCLLRVTQTVFMDRSAQVLFSGKNVLNYWLLGSQSTFSSFENELGDCFRFRIASISARVVSWVHFHIALLLPYKCWNFWKDLSRGRVWKRAFLRVILTLRNALTWSIEGHDKDFPSSGIAHWMPEYQVH